MSIIINETVKIDAAHSVVWNVITDFRSYRLWNPFVVACDSTGVVGDPIEMRVRVFRSFAQPQREIVVEHDPGRRFCYGLSGVPFEAIRSRRCHDVRATGPRSSEYCSRFELSGRLSPIVSSLLGTRLRRGFHEMTEAIRVRSQQLAQAETEAAEESR